jgi:hypothetical protein
MRGFAPPSRRGLDHQRKRAIRVEARKPYRKVLRVLLGDEANGVVVRVFGQPRRIAKLARRQQQPPTSSEGAAGR